MTAEQRVGDLVEVRLVHPVSEAEFFRFMAEVRRIVRSSDRPVCFCTDWRNAGVLPEEIADPFVWMMRQDNPGISRTAIVVGSLGTAQVQRMVRDAQSERRKICLDVEEALAFLRPVATHVELARAEAFLREAGEQR